MQTATKQRLRWGIAFAWKHLKNLVEGAGTLKAPEAVIEKGENNVVNMVLFGVAAIILLAGMNLPSEWVSGLVGWLVVGAVRTMLAALLVAVLIRGFPRLRKIGVAAVLFAVVWVSLWLYML